MENNCIFCKLANGQIPTTTLYEDEYFRVIFDANPASKGHALILPKEHYANVYELGDEEASRVFVLAKKLAGILAEELGCDGLNILQNNGEAAGQTVFHFHMHLVPRSKGDDIKIGWAQGTADEEFLKSLAEKVNAKMISK